MDVFTLTRPSGTLSHPIGPMGEGVRPRVTRHSPSPFAPDPCLTP
jgi:hypothetical protein